MKHNAPDNGQFHNHKIQDHKDKYFDTSRKNLSQEMTMCNMEALVSYPKEVMTNVIFFKNWSNAKVKRLSTLSLILGA